MNFTRTANCAWNVSPPPGLGLRILERTILVSGGEGAIEAAEEAATRDHSDRLRPPFRGSRFRSRRCEVVPVWWTLRGTGMVVVRVEDGQPGVAPVCEAVVADQLDLESVVCGLKRPRCRRCRTDLARKSPCASHSPLGVHQTEAASRKVGSSILPQTNSIRRVRIPAGGAIPCNDGKHTAALPDREGSMQHNQKQPISNMKTNSTNAPVHSTLSSESVPSDNSTIQCNSSGRHGALLPFLRLTCAALLLCTAFATQRAYGQGIDLLGIKSGSTGGVKHHSNPRLSLGLSLPTDGQNPSSDHLGNLTPLPAPPLPQVTTFGRLGAIGCYPSQGDEKLKLLPRPFPMPDFSVRNLFGFNGNDDGCIRMPGKPIRPIPLVMSPSPIV